MSEAPSERHLEDWIVANPELFGYWWNPDVTPNVGFIEAFDAIIARQPCLPLGIPDLIANRSGQVVAVELKAGQVTTKTIAQCLRYMACLQEILGWALFERRDEIMGVPDNRYKWELTGYPDHVEIAGIVVGKSVQDPNLYWVAAKSDIEIYTYDYDPNLDAYSFQCLHLEELENNPSSDVYQDWARGAIGDAFVNILNRKSRADHD